MPRGVDLSLDQFNLSLAAEAGSWAGTLEAPEEAATLAIKGELFWSALSDATKQVFAQEDKELLSNIYNPNLSDRREDKDAFVPPPTSLTYMHKLKALVKEEQQVQEDRKKLFLSADFNQDKAGPLFPSSWNASIEIEHEDRGSKSLRLRPDFKAEESLLEEVLKTSVPTFDKETEDGTRFYIYRLGSLEVRATQVPTGKKVVGAVFSLSSRDTIEEPEEGQDNDRIIKAMQFVEKAPIGALRCRYYVVFETAMGRRYVTERLSNGVVAWKVSPDDIEDRNSLAKVICTTECNGAAVGDVRNYLVADARRPKTFKSKQYARAAFRHVGESRRISSA